MKAATIPHPSPPLALPNPDPAPCIRVRARACARARSSWSDTLDAAPLSGSSSGGGRLSLSASSTGVREVERNTKVLD